MSKQLSTAYHLSLLRLHRLTPGLQKQRLFSLVQPDGRLKSVGVQTWLFLTLQAGACRDKELWVKNAFCSGLAQRRGKASLKHPTRIVAPMSNEG